MISPTIEGAAVVNPSTPTTRDKGKFLLNFVNENNSLKNEAVYVKHKDDSDNLNIDHHNVLNRIGQGNTGTGTNLIKVKAGINVKGYDGELVASLMRSGENFTVYLSAVNIGKDSSASAVQPASGSWTGSTGNSGNVTKLMGGTVYFPLDMAVGDFNNDGYANEIVVVDTNRIGVHYKLIQITHTGSTSKDAAFSIKQISGGDAGGYDYVNWNPIYAGRYANQDGVSCTYSICTVAGDLTLTDKRNLL